MNEEVQVLEQRIMRHLGNGLAFELALIALIETHPQKDVLLARLTALRKTYTELVQGSIMMVDDVSPQTSIAVKQLDKALDRLFKAAQ